MLLLLLPILLLLAPFHTTVINSEEEIKPRKGNLKDAHKTNPVNDEEIARLIKVDYWFETESILYDVIENKINAPSTLIQGNFSFQTLHHDKNGHALAKFQLTKCYTDNCGDIPPVYVSYTQGGNNIQGVYMDIKNGEVKPSWNFIFGIINTLYTPAEYGEGDTQTVSTMYGDCKVLFGRPEDKKFRRKIENCHLGATHNSTRYDGLHLVDYHQDVWYTQNFKYDADIILIDAIESISFESSLDKKWGFTAESRTHVEIRNRTRTFVPRQCVIEETAEECALKAHNATRIGHRLYENVKIGIGRKDSLSKAVESYRIHLHEMGDTHTCHLHASLFAEIVRAGRFASKEEWINIIKNADNEPLLHIIGNALGALGNVETLNIAREVLFIEGEDLVDHYLFGAAHSINTEDKWQKQMMYWLADSISSQDKYWKIANTLASIFYKSCIDTTSSWNACSKNPPKIITKFVSDITKCNDEKCHNQALKTLYNLPIPICYEYAKQFLCSTYSEDIQTSALLLIDQLQYDLLDAKLIPILIKIFRNVCPLSTSTTASQIAVDILIKYIPDNQHVATLLLRSESLSPIDHEKWKYFYDAVHSSGENDELKAAFWRKMRMFKVFRPNYLHRSLIANSNVHSNKITEIGGYKVDARAAVEYNKDIFKRSNTHLTLQAGKKKYPLFGLNIATSGLDSFVDNGSSSSSSSSSSSTPSASIRMSIMGNALPEYILFNGTGELMSAVWNADGQTIKAFEASTMLKDSFTTLPLLSGLSIDISSLGALSLRIIGSCEVSLWNKDSKTIVTAEIASSLNVSSTLIHHSIPIHHISSEITIVSSIGSTTDVLFDSLPYKTCLTMERKNAIQTFTSIDEQLSSPKAKRRSLKRKTIHPGITFAMDETTRNQCNIHRKSIKQ